MYDVPAAGLAVPGAVPGTPSAVSRTLAAVVAQLQLPPASAAPAE